MVILVVMCGWTVYENDGGYIYSSHEHQGDRVSCLFNNAQPLCHFRSSHPIHLLKKDSYPV